MFVKLLSVLPILLTLSLNQSYVVSFMLPGSYKLYPSKIQQYHDNRSFQNPIKDSTKVYSSYRESNGRTLSRSKNRRYSSNEDDRTKLNRTKFLLNQARGNLQESEMRATAAERRVALLQAELKKLNEGKTGSQNDADELIIGNTSEDTEKVNELNKKILDLKEAIKNFRIKMKEEVDKVETIHLKEKADWRKQQEKLQNDLDWAQTEHVEALEKVSELKTVIDELTQDLDLLKEQSKNELEELKSNHSKQIHQLEVEALEVQNSLKATNLKLETELKEEKTNTEKISSDLIRADNQIYALKRQLGFQESELSDRNEQIDALYEERSSIRAMTKIQFTLLKSRIKKRCKNLIGKKD